MKYVQYLCFEISLGCNYSERHGPKCPVNDPDRWKNLNIEKPMSDEEIVLAARLAYSEMGFRGLVGFHYYNEPTMAWDRMMAIVNVLRDSQPNSGFVLWTNAILLKPEYKNDLLKFSQVHLTPYENYDGHWLIMVKTPMKFHTPILDKRTEVSQVRTPAPCTRIFNELVLDYYGNAHPCCMDWRGGNKLGNIRDEGGFPKIVENYLELRKNVSRKKGMKDPVERCITCFSRGGGQIADLVPKIADETRKMRETSKIEEDAE